MLILVLSSNMKKTHKQLETIFEKITSLITVVLGNSITFILALAMIIFWFSNRDFATQELNETIRDIIHGVTFLSLFVIQKEFNRFSGSLHVKVNELVASSEIADNAVIDVESKTEVEINERQKEYTNLVKDTKQSDEKK